MKTGPLVAMICLLLIAVPSLGAAQGASKAKPPAGTKRMKIDLAKVEQRIFAKLNLTSQQKSETDRLMATMESQAAAVHGKGLVPHDPRADRAKLIKIAVDYQNGLKKTLTADQYKKYSRMHADVSYTLKQLSQHRRGVHF